MKKILVSLVLTSLAAPLLPAAALALPLPTPELAQADEAAAERDSDYREGRSALDDERWDDAVSHFSEVAARGGKDADAALYWKAYALDKAGERADALAAIAELESRYAESRWRDDARALKAEMGKVSESADDPDSDDDLKLLALNSLMNASSERALDMLERFLDGEHSEKLKSRALFVLSQSSSERAREILVGTARGSRGPELQKTAIRYLGMTAGRASDELAAIYAAASDPEVKKDVLKAYMLSQDVGKVMQVYRGEKDPELRAAAVKQLGVMQAGDELVELYRTEASPEVRKQVLKALFVGGHAEALIGIYRSETDPELKGLAIRNLGLTNSDEARGFLVQVYRSESDRDLKADVLKALFLSQATDELVDIVRSEKDAELKGIAVKNLGLTNKDDARQTLVELYGSESSAEVKKDILKALFLSQGAKELIAIARKETDPELRKYAIRNIGLIGSDEAVEFMMEVLEKE